MTRRRKAPPNLLALALASALAAAVAPAGSAGLQLPSLPGLPNLPRLPTAPAPTQAATSVGDLPLSSRHYEALQQLLQKGTVNGQDLVTELVSLRALMAQRRSAAVMGAVLGTADSSGGGFDPRAELLVPEEIAAPRNTSPAVAVFCPSR